VQLIVASTTGHPIGARLTFLQDSPADTAVNASVVPLNLTEWDFSGDPAVTDFSLVETEFGAGFNLTPGIANEGVYAAERSLGDLGIFDVVALRFRILIEDLPTAIEDRRWFQSVATLSDEQGRSWSVNLSNTIEGGMRFNTGFFVPQDISGGASAEISHSPGTWHCVELVLDAAGNPASELLVDAETLVALTDDEAAEHGSTFALSLGPRWLEESDLAPAITIADVAVSDTPLGCEPN